MTGKSLTSEVKVSKAMRRITVGYVRRGHEERKTKIPRRYSVHPSLSLQGNWLAEAGFPTGVAVSVTVEFGQLIIRPCAE
nr:SymE family type I addiction module toxin [uncultured Enterobacter sp.]